MDPLADKLLIIAALVSLVSLDRLAAWVAMVIIAREFAVTVLRTIAAERGIVIAASWLGKVKTVLQIAAIFALIAANPAPLWVDVLVYLAVAVTVISGADYFFGLRRRIEESATPREPLRDGSGRLGASSHSRIVMWRRECSPLAELGAQLAERCRSARRRRCGGGSSPGSPGGP